jgi:hypothetical protein
MESGEQKIFLENTLQTGKAEKLWTTGAVIGSLSVKKPLKETTIPARIVDVLSKNTDTKWMFTTKNTIAYLKIKIQLIG